MAGERPLCMNATSLIGGERQRVCGQDYVVAPIREIGCTVNEMASALPDYNKMPAEEMAAVARRKNDMWNSRKNNRVARKNEEVRDATPSTGKMKDTELVEDVIGGNATEVLGGRELLIQELKHEMAKRNARKVLIQEVQDELSRRHAIEEEAMAEIEKEEKTAKELHMHYSQLRFASETSKAAPLTIPQDSSHDASPLGARWTAGICS